MMLFVSIIPAKWMLTIAAVISRLLSGASVCIQSKRSFASCEKQGEGKINSCKSSLTNSLFLLQKKYVTLSSSSANIFRVA